MKSITIGCLSLGVLAMSGLTVHAADAEQEVQASEMTNYIAESESDWVGSAIATGDVNGDGYMDALIGAELEGEIDESGSTPGTVYLILGSESVPANEVPLGNADAKLNGEAGGDQVGFSVAIGNVNGDDFDDMIIGAIGEGGGGVNPGAVYVVFGSSDPEPLLLLSDADIKYVAEGDDRAGESVAAGDVNGDGFDDILIGAEIVDMACDIVNVGSVYVIYGSSTTLPSGVTNLSTADAQLSGTIQSSNFGSGLATGDYNGDDIDDIVIAAENWGEDEDEDYRADTDKDDMGAVYVVLGQAEPMNNQHLGTFEPCEEAPSFTPNVTYYRYTGENKNDLTGTGIATGDYNGDGFDEVVVGATGYDYNSITTTGIAYMLYGSSTPATSGSLSGTVTKFVSEVPGSLGTAVAMGDVDEDGYDDLLLGAPIEAANGTASGAAWLIGGVQERQSGFITVQGNASIHYIGEAPNSTASLFGNIAAMGDYNGDGNADVWLGAPTHAETGAQAGRAFLHFVNVSDDDSAAVSKIIPKKYGKVKVKYEDGTSVTHDVFKTGKGKPKAKLAKDKEHIVALKRNGKLVKVVDVDTGEITASKKINGKKQTKTSLKVSNIYSEKSYESVVVLTVRKKQARLIVMRLTKDDNLRKKVTRKFDINNRKIVKLKVKPKKDRIITTVGKGAKERVKAKWKLKRSGKLKQLN